MLQFLRIRKKQGYVYSGFSRVTTTKPCTVNVSTLEPEQDWNEYNYHHPSGTAADQ